MHDRFETSSRDDLIEIESEAWYRAVAEGKIKPNSDTPAPLSRNDLFGPRPPVRVDDVVIFLDGTSRPLTADELARMKAGEEVLVDPRSGRRTRLVGEGVVEPEPLTELRVYRCARGHRWDVWGVVTRRGTFVPGGQPRIFFCPTCDRHAVDVQGHEPERLT